MKPFGQKNKEFSERVVKVNRITRVVKGGRRLRFRATVVIGNHRGKIGLGVDKANEISDAVSKAAAKAKNNLIEIPIVNDTIPHEIRTKLNSTTILFKPAVPGTGIIAGSAVREIIEISGIKNIVAKIIGSRNKINSSKATILALSQLSTKEDLYAKRGKEVYQKKGATPPTPPAKDTVDETKPKKPVKTSKPKTDKPSKK